jgi:hypothetical protein
MSEEKQNGADVDLKIAGQEVKLKNVKSLNTILTLIAAVGVCFGTYLLVEHKADAKSNGETLTSVMKDMAQAIREGNCINSYPEHERKDNVELCKVRAR